MERDGKHIKILERQASQAPRDETFLKISDHGCQGRCGPQVIHKVHINLLVLQMPLSCWGEDVAIIIRWQGIFKAYLRHI